MSKSSLIHSPNPKIDTSNGIEFGLYSLGDHLPNPHTKKRISAKERIQELIELAKLAEDAGFDIFQLGESHQEYFVSQSHLLILTAIAKATKNIRLSSAVTTIGVLDPVRVYEDAATLDLISNGRMELIAGRASRFGSFELLGYNSVDYRELFEEKFELLLKLNESERVTWEGEFRAPLNDALILPRPLKNHLPIWRGLGNTMTSAIRAGELGVPVFQATLAGAVITYANRINNFRSAAKEAGHDIDNIPVGTGGWVFIRESTKEAYRQVYPHINEGFKLTNGESFPKRALAQGQSVKSVVTIGEPSLIIEKILYQYEAFKQQRFSAEIDFAGMEFDEVKKTLYLLADKVMPTVKKYTKS